MSDIKGKFDRLLDALESGTEVPGDRILEAAERIVNSQSREDADAATWHRFLEFTGGPAFLQSLRTRGHRYRWADTCFRAILLSQYSLESMLADRILRHPERILFREASGKTDAAWSYSQTTARLKATAALFCSVEAEPRVAIFCENSVDSACCDLACLVHRIFDTPLSVHFDSETLAWIFNRLSINIAIADTEERVQRLVHVRSMVSLPFRILHTGVPGREAADDASESLADACARVDLEHAAALLRERSGLPITDVATVMFTSGSTGAPKGIAFTHYQIVAKRFARAAALPGVGNDEILLCYLPLFHTFGRFLEMLGMLYWRGTYVFAGNPSVESLVAQMQDVRPTGLISVPLRWSQIRDLCIESLRESDELAAQEASVRRILGGRLRWGLSAAGHLDARVFRFFQRFGVDLCSGFGMTEATGGITMTPPKEYVDGTVGIPLPGIRVRFGEGNELQVCGPYVARYLEEGKIGDMPPQDPSEEYWLSTGDVFKEHPGGYLEIVDRVKDIYKNNRGQTVAPRKVEQRFEGVPGIRRVFLAGDARDSNVLLIVPDRSDPVLQVSEAGIREYFHKIVGAANEGLAPYERVVNFALLDRDLEPARGELTPKGSYRRKVIESNFSHVIEPLYRGNVVELRCGRLRIRIPRWLFRDLGILEDDIAADNDGLINAVSGQKLTIQPCEGQGFVNIGALEYRLTGNSIDLGLFSRQPRLWIGNPALAAFCPCRDGWDLPMTSVAQQVRLPWRSEQDGIGFPDGQAGSIRIGRLRQVHRACVDALFAPADAALAAVQRLAEELRSSDERLAGAIRRRLEALARHPTEAVRCLAYRVLLMDEPVPDYSGVFPSFVESGLTFLNEDSIRAIAQSGFGDSRLKSLRRRLFSYRKQLDWPAAEVTRAQFVKICRLLADFAVRDPSYFVPVRAELASWSLHRTDPELAAEAERSLARVVQAFESQCASAAGPPLPADRFVFEDGLPPATLQRLHGVLRDPTFLKQSVTLVFEEDDLDISRLPDSGIWVSQVLSQHQFDLYRCGINLNNGRHLDLLIAIGGRFEDSLVRDTLYWLMALSEHPLQASVLPRIGACRPDLGAISVAYISDLTMWEKIREFSCARTVRAFYPSRRDWRRLLVRGMAAFFEVWQASGGSIVPGAVTPSNVVVPDADFREGARVLSLTGWKPYLDPLSLIIPLVRNFYRQTAAYYPKAAAQLELRWIFDACMEALGAERGALFLMELEAALPETPEDAELNRVAAALAGYRDKLREQPYLPLPLLCAIDRFSDWLRENRHASHAARAEEVEQLYWLYRLDRFPEMFRYRLYLDSYFAQAAEPARAAFERLLARLHRHPGATAPHLEEMYDLQAAIEDPNDREVFGRMVFRHARREQHLEVLAVGSSERRQMIVRSEVEDLRGMRYSVRETVSPAEIGQLYRILREADYPLQISEQEQHLVVADDGERVVGGLTWLPQGRDVAYLRSIVVVQPLRGRGIGGGLLEDLCIRLAAGGVVLVKADFLIRRFYQAHDFRVDSRCGGLVRRLGTATPDKGTEWNHKDF